MIKEIKSGRIVYSVEHLPEFAEEFAGHFIGFSAHMHEEYKRNSCFLNSLVSGVRVTPFDEIIFPKMRVPREFFAMYTPPLSDNGKQAITLKMEDQVIGYYIPDDNVLIASDWSHSSTTIAAAKRIMKHLPIPDMGKIKITVGCDPEFELTYSGKIINVSDIAGWGGTSAKIGKDGAGSQLELRPDPGNPRDVVENIRNLFREIKARSPNYGVSVVGDRYPLGGHLHFGADWGKRSPELIELLDDFLGRAVIELSGKARGSYAALHAFREQPWGFEYRTPPSAVFATPKITEIALKIGQNLVSTYACHGKVIYEVDDTTQLPTAEAYIQVAGLTPQELKCFQSFIRVFKDKKNRFYDILPYWIGTNPQEVAVSPRAIFNDDWNPAIVDTIQEYLQQITISPTHPVQEILLYGLRKERGLVSTIPIEGWETVEHLDERPPNAVGLPFEFRVHGSSRGIERVVAAIVKHFYGIEIPERSED